jgi:hypothetical protein
MAWQIFFGNGKREIFFLQPKHILSATKCIFFATNIMPTTLFPFFFSLLLQKEYVFVAEKISPNGKHTNQERKGKRERKKKETNHEKFWHNVLQMLNEPLPYSSFLFGILVWFNKFRTGNCWKDQRGFPFSILCCFFYSKFHKRHLIKHLCKPITAPPATATCPGCWKSLWIC